MRTLRFTGTSLLVVIVVAALVAGFFWGVDTSRPPTAAVDDRIDYSVFVVEEATLGRTISGIATIEWPTESDIDVPIDGRVTKMPVDDGVIDDGDILLHVDGVPVVVIAGATPAFRDLRRGVAGDDVAQLQRYLASIGFDLTVDGEYGRETERAVRDWNAVRGIGKIADLPLGWIVFVEPLPTRVQPSDDLRLGAVLPQPAVSTIRDTPRIAIPLLPAAASEVEVGDEVVIGDGIRSSVTSGPRTQPDGGLTIEVDASPFSCGTTRTCIVTDVVRTEPAEIVLLPEVTGPAVPELALGADAQGDTHVVMADGSRRAVTVRASADGLALVDGIDAGETVRVPTP
ncbi:MAG: peptidoglycan-binding domain-containing protein [Ilumatobacter sp.]|uniref:peptidoglycan-binding domain-containing protein n=1 Tax=Ilumatobacter sp. TaxID=1967498 RepID=UPI002635C5C4|nr:peptidoglycan-binding domain-containing protein [Ilumatobacter sp.]MDJ0767912.1 peptidoglycan-binding domain-containing protein [Ilumatobacter sp.]